MFLCRMLLEKGANPNGTTTDDQADNVRSMPLMRAIETGDKVLVEILLDHGAKIDVTDPSNVEYETPLLWAVKCGNVDIVSLLLERGADAKYEESPWPVSPLFLAATLISPVMVETLIKHGANIQWTKSNGWSILHAAYDSADTLSMLLQNGADINATDHNNWTTIMWAARFDHKKSLELLLKQTNPKADLEVMSKDELELEPASTALHIACQHRSRNAVHQLLEAGADINRQSGDGKFPYSFLLESQVGEDDEHCVELILKRRPNLGLADDEGNTVLHSIQSDSSLSVVMRLVEAGAPVNTFNDLGYNPVFQAVRVGNSAVARYLITVKGSQADVCHETDGGILRSAVMYCSAEVVRLLVRTGAEHSLLDPVHGESVLYSAIGDYNDRDRRNINNYRDRRNIIRYLVEEVGVDVNAAGGELVNPFMRAVIDKDEDNKHLLKYLLKHGAHVDSTDSLGRNSVHWAVLRDKLDVLKMLVKNGGDLTAGDNYGRTPLHFAAGKSSLEIVRYILDKLSKGSEASYVDVADVDGWTPLIWACRDTDGFGRAAEVLVKEYKADIRVRSEDAEWSPLKLARLHDWPYSWAIDLDPDLDAQGHEENRESQYYSQIAPGMDRWYDCVGCDMV
ncbi:hypothetical protein SLS64_013377 [Diaporthe eres]